MIMSNLYSKYANSVWLMTSLQTIVQWICSHIWQNNERACMPICLLLLIWPRDQLYYQISLFLSIFLTFEADLKMFKNHFLLKIYQKASKKTQFYFNLFGWQWGFCHPLRPLCFWTYTVKSWITKHSTFARFNCILKVFKMLQKRTLIRFLKLQYFTWKFNLFFGGFSCFYKFFPRNFKRIFHSRVHLREYEMVHERSMALENSSDENQY